MELTPQQIDDRRHAEDLQARASRRFSTGLLSELEKKALVLHPPVNRQTQSVPENIRNLGVELVKLKNRSPRIRKHVLP